MTLILFSPIRQPRPRRPGLRPGTPLSLAEPDQAPAASELVALDRTYEDRLATNDYYTIPNTSYLRVAFGDASTTIYGES